MYLSLYLLINQKESSQVILFLLVYDRPPSRAPTVSPRFHRKEQTLGNASWSVVHLHLLSTWSVLRGRPSPGSPGPSIPVPSKGIHASVVVPYLLCLGRYEYRGPWWEITGDEAEFVPILVPSPFPVFSFFKVGVSICYHKLGAPTYALIHTCWWVPQHMTYEHMDIPRVLLSKKNFGRNTQTSQFSASLWETSNVSNLSITSLLHGTR
jgi:hypothetical protein